jgi:hypothetical protein
MRVAAAKSTALLTALPVAAGLTLTLAPVAQAAHPCGKVATPGHDPARVATVRVPCASGREVAALAYSKVAEEEVVRFRVRRFRCEAVLAETELSCRHNNRWIFASTQPTDHPGEWHVPHPYWRHCTPVRGVLGGDMLTHRVSCSKGRKVIRKVFVKSQTAQSPHIHVLGYTCGLHPYAKRAITCHKGSRRILSPLAG